jgi:hypothetical protein
LGSVLESDIDLNDIRDVARKLDSKPNLAPDVRSFLNLSDEWYHRPKCWDAYFDCDDTIPHAQDSPPGDLTAEDESHEDGKQPWRSAGLAEALHIVHLSRAAVENFFGKGVSDLR